jgi:hypothetical protein
VLDTLIGGLEPLCSGTSARLSPPINVVGEQANDGAGMRIDIAPLDLLRIAWKQQAVALIDLLLRGAQGTH